MLNLPAPGASERLSRRRRLSLPFTRKETLEAGLKKLHDSWRQPIVLVPHTTAARDIAHYEARHAALNFAGPRPKLRAAIETDTATAIAMRVDTGLKLLELGQAADPWVKPILLYYSCHYLSGAYADAYLTWTCDRSLHGLAPDRADESLGIGGIQVRITRRGFFPRLATTCFLFTGCPTPFSGLVTYAMSPAEEYTRPGRELAGFGTEIGEPLRSLSLEDLVKFNPRERKQEVTRRHGVWQESGAMLFLVDVLTLYLGSVLARYDVLAWREILEGVTSDYRLHFDAAFERFETFAADRLLAMIENPGITMGQVTQDGGSPYYS